MLETEIKVNRFLIEYVVNLLNDVPDEQMADQPFPAANHPAWIVGHLTASAESIVTLLGGVRRLPENWTELFGQNTEPSTDRSKYPSKKDLIELLVDRYRTACELLEIAPTEALKGRNPRPHMIEHLPTVGDLVSFAITGHVGIHTGQLSMWRRAMGIGRLF
ncbi:DinB family protein [Planctomicrobium sp. SH668]|uniref:DinB family protein n=1 Tax=Planctomicrobium sp. SH668 TaxID=3448126 RepID=UPI003F5C64A0